MDQSPADVPVPAPLARLTALVEESPEALASGGEDVRVAALTAAKYIFDIALQTETDSIHHITKLLASLSPAEAPQTRSQTRASSKRKRSPSPLPAPIPALPMLQPTPLASLFVDGMDEDQLWAQLEMRTKIMCDTLEYALDAGGEDADDDAAGESPAKKRRELLEEDDTNDLDDLEMFEAEMDAMDSDDDTEEEEEEEEGEEDESDDSGDDADLGEEVVELRDASSDEEPGGTLFSQISSALKRAEQPVKRPGHAALDDGFFSLNQFNAEIEEAESRRVSAGGLGKRLDEPEEDSDEDDNMSVDLFKPIDGDGGEEDLGDAPEPYYRDFFDPPPRAAPAKAKTKNQETPVKKASKVRFHEEVRVKNIKARGRGVPVSMLSLLGPKQNGSSDDDDDDDDEYEDDGEDDGQGLVEDEADEDEDDEDEEEGDEDDELEGDLDDASEEDGRETIERFRDDLFADEEDEVSKTDLTAHQRRQAELRAQIEALEAENVGKKEWTLMGEATARSRPQNSLLEEDLDFERVTKAVPVVTEEVVQALEERIKARILEGQFDDVVRQRQMDDKPFLPSRFFELQDTKSKQSLAEIYEDEYVSAQTGGVAGEDRDGKLKKEHDEIQKMWEGICYKLDALCNAHFTPKQPKATISSISNVAVATLESALPTSKATATMLAPEEVFAPSTSDMRARSELTPDEKRAQRNKLKKAKMKERDSLEKSVDNFSGKANSTKGVKKQKEEALKSVVKHGKGVTVVGKKSKDVLAKKERLKSK